MTSTRVNRITQMGKQKGIIVSRGPFSTLLFPGGGEKVTDNEDPA